MTAQPKRYFLSSTFRYQASRLTTLHALSFPQLAAQVLGHSTYFQEHLRPALSAFSIPPHVLSLPAHLRLQPSIAQPPTPIIPLLTPRARPVSPPWARTQRTSDQLAYGAKGHRSSTCVFIRRKYAGRARYASQRDCTLLPKPHPHPLVSPLAKLGPSTWPPFPLASPMDPQPELTRHHRHDNHHFRLLEHYADTCLRSRPHPRLLYALQELRREKNRVGGGGTANGSTYVGPRHGPQWRWICSNTTRNEMPIRPQ